MAQEMNKECTFENELNTPPSLKLSHRQLLCCTEPKVFATKKARDKHLQFEKECYPK